MNKQQQKNGQKQKSPGANDRVLRDLNRDRAAGQAPSKDQGGADKRDYRQYQTETGGRQQTDDDHLAEDKARAEGEGMTRHKETNTPEHRDHSGH